VADPVSLADRAAQLIAELEHASVSNAPITPVMLGELKALVAEALANSQVSDAALADALGQTQHAREIARRVQSEANDIAASVGSLAGA